MKRAAQWVSFAALAGTIVPPVLFFYGTVGLEPEDELAALVGREALPAILAGMDAEALDRLRAWMQAEGLKELSPPVYGYFDPPWTPGFLRRNEVMLRTEAGK